MEFSGLRTSSLVESKLDSLLSDTEPTLESLFEQPDFISKLHLSDSKLIEYLSRESTISQIMVYLSTIGDPAKQTYAECYHYPFFAFNVLSNCHPTITRAFLSYKLHLDALFSITKLEGDEYTTCHGYAQGIYKNLLSDGNPLNDEFVLILVDNYEKYLLPFLRNLNIANAEMIAATLTSYHFKLKKTQENLFEDLVAFNFEILKESDHYEDLANNIKKILETVANEGFIYKSQLNDQILPIIITHTKNLDHQLHILKAKLAFFTYNVKSDVLMHMPDVCDLYNHYYIIEKQFGSKGILVLMLDFFKLASKNHNLNISFNSKIIGELISLVKKNCYNDVIHFSIFSTLANLRYKIIESKETYRIVVDFLLNSKSLGRVPNKVSKRPNHVSLSFINDLAKLLLNAEIQDKSLSMLKSELSAEFGKLCFADDLTEISNVDDLSDVKVLSKDSSGYYKLAKSGIEDRRFRDEEDIAPPELLSDIEKFSAGSLVIQMDLFDSLVIDEPKPMEELIDIKINEDSTNNETGNLILPLKQNEIRRSYRPKSPHIRRGSHDEIDKEFKNRLFSPEPSLITRKSRFNDSYNDLVNEVSKKL